MKKLMISLSALLILTGFACAKKVNLPIKTSLGDLVKVEKKDKVPTDKETIAAKADEDVYVLNFEGQKEIVLNDVPMSDAFKLAQFPLVDSAGKNFVSVFVGGPAKDGAVSTEKVSLSGSMTGKADGKFWVTGGKLEFPEAKVTLVYVVPKNASLTFKDGGQQYPIN
ncbi:MAG: hypothetical protein M3539_12000 [Acidobacteriota bacterium]|nr:hypothetical protein [Acidobacteriota bacterium]